MIGHTLGHYRVLEELGKGGMGEVYRAHDEVLGREVAIKLLPEEFSADPERLVRFEREAKVLAALNHPHIGAIYGLEQDDGRHYLVLELVEGETLAERIKRGPLPVTEAVPLAIQIARGLEAAHESGMIHRDLKPANIKITPEGDVKILDFGLAKPTEAVLSGDLSESPTLTYSPTGVGVVLGTAAYMSPEQVRAKEVDRRTDIWAFGVVLWEMLTGKKLFQGDTVSDVLASTLMREPDWEGLPEGLPAGVLRVLRRCLVQDPKERLHDIADARIELQEAFDEPEIEAAVPVEAPPWWQRALPWLAVPLALVGGWLLRPVPQPEPQPVLRWEIPLPEGERVVHRFRHGVALSADSKLLAFTSGSLSQEDMTPKGQLYLQRLDERQPRPVAGTEAGYQPILSPDGEWLAFIASDPPRLLKVPIRGGQSQTLCECDASFGATWGPGDTIVFASQRGPLQQVSSAGGEPKPLTRLNEEAGESSHRLPHFLPDGRAVIFTSIQHYRDWDRSAIHAYILSSGEHKPLLEGGSDARFVPPGYLVLAREGQLVAARFDPDRLEVYGEEVPVLEGVNHSIYTFTSLWRTGAANFAVSRTGAIAYLSGSVFPEIPKGVSLVNRQGEPIEALPVEPKQYLATRVSPDGRRALLATHYKPDDVWLFDLDRGTLTRQTFEGRHGWAIWGPGADEFTVAAYQDGQWLVYSKLLGSGPGRRRILWSGAREFRISSWSPDGQHLAMVLTDPRNVEKRDIWLLSEDGDPAPFLDSEFSEGFPEFSPDGRWIAYVTNESGRGEVYVRPFPGPGPAVQVSSAGGWEPAWSPDGRELYYRSEDHLVAVEVDTRGDRLLAGRPVDLFGDKYSYSIPVRSYDVTPDGGFLLIDFPDATDFRSSLEEFSPERIHFVQNWTAELEDKLP